MSDFISTFHFVEMETDADTDRAAAAKENASRNAQVEITYLQTGVGQKRIPETLIFPVIFKTQPHFTCGSGVVTNPNHDIWNDPRGTSGVVAWRCDSRGFFIGVRMWVHLAMDRKPITATTSGDKAKAHQNQQLNPGKAKVEHFMTFSAVAFKDLPTNTVDPAMTPRKVGYK
jgi:hypothetical protein